MYFSVDYSSIIFIILEVVIIVLVVFLICREFVNWYIKSNKSLHEYKETTVILRKILEEMQAAHRQAGFDYIEPASIDIGTFEDASGESGFQKEILETRFGKYAEQMSGSLVSAIILGLFLALKISFFIAGQYLPFKTYPILSVFEGMVLALTILHTYYSVSWFPVYFCVGDGLINIVQLFRFGYLLSAPRIIALLLNEILVGVLLSERKRLKNGLYSIMILSGVLIRIVIRALLLAGFDLYGTGGETLFIIISAAIVLFLCSRNHSLFLKLFLIKDERFREEPESILALKDEISGWKWKKDISYCPYCGKSIEAGSNYCIYCGKEFKKGDK